MKKSEKVKQIVRNFPKRFYQGNKKFIWKMVIIIVAGNIALLFKHYQEQKAYQEEFPLGMEVTDFDEYLYMRGGGAHAVNIYGYEYTAANSVLFTVYDNNIPQDCKDGYMINADSNGNCYLQVTIRKDEGGNDILEYLYMPLRGSKEYIASSMKNLMKFNAMVVMDENWNVLN